MIVIDNSYDQNGLEHMEPMHHEAAVVERKTLIDFNAPVDLSTPASKSHQIPSIFSVHTRGAHGRLAVLSNATTGLANTHSLQVTEKIEERKMKQILCMLAFTLISGSAIASASSPYFPAQGRLKPQGGCEGIGIQAGQTVKFEANKNQIELVTNDGTLLMDVNADSPKEVDGALLVLGAETQNFTGIVGPRGTITVEGRLVGIGFLRADETSSSTIEISGSAYVQEGNQFIAPGGGSSFSCVLSK